MCHICGHSFTDQKNMDAHVKNHSKSDESKANILNSIDNALNKQGESSQAESADKSQEEEQSEEQPEEEQSEEQPEEEQSEEQPDETPQEQPGKNPEKETAETPQGTQSQPNLFSEEYIDSLMQLNPDFAEESQHSEESSDSTED